MLSQVASRLGLPPASRQGEERLKEDPISEQVPPSPPRSSRFYFWRRGRTATTFQEIAVDRAQAADTID